MEFNLAQVHEAIAEAIPDRECIVFRDRRLTWKDVTERTRRLANALGAAGLGARPNGRDGLKGHESHEDHLAIYLYNGNEYLESMLGAFKARVGPINVNYRYVTEELQYLLDNSQAKAIVYHSQFAPTLAEVLPQLPELTLLLQVDDESGNELLPGAQWYEEALTAASPERPACADSWSPDDLYILYTGGTTGMPKGVLWRQHDVFLSAMGGRPWGSEQALASYDELADKARASAGGRSLMMIPPFMHGAAQWVAFNAVTMGGRLIIPDDVERMRPAAVLRLAERERVLGMPVVGDAIARPLLDEIETGQYDLSGLVTMTNGGAPLSPT